MRNHQARHDYVPHIRHWSPGLIAITAKARIEFLLGLSNRSDAQAMIDEWVLS
jgi:hypothetical protein